MNDNKIQIIEDDEIDLRAMIQVLWNDRKRILQITAVITLIGVLYALLATPLYKSTITIYPSGQESGGQLSQFKSMASAFGISTGGTQKSLDIGDILSSRSLQKKLIYHEWNSENWNEPVNLIAYWDIDDTSTFSIPLNPIKWIKLFFSLFISSSESNLEFKYEMAAISLLSDRIKMEKYKTGLYNISVWMEEKDLAADIANEIYDVLVEFITISHVNKARMNREFIQERLQDVSIELEYAEESLKIFRENNRSLAESPQLQLELGRHTRGVELQYQLYMTLLEQFELIKIKELDETPTLTVLDNAVPALSKDKPQIRLIVIIAIIFGLLGSVIITIIRNVSLDYHP